MYFEYSSGVWISENDIEEMKEKIKYGVDPKIAFEDWRAGLDDVDYYEVAYVREHVIKELTNT